MLEDYYVAVLLKSKTRRRELVDMKLFLHQGGAL